MKNATKKTNFKTRLQNRFTALIALLAITIFAPQLSWAAMAPSASRGASLATQRAAQQLYPTLAPAAQRLGLTGRGGTASVQAAQEAAVRAQQLELEQRRARVQAFTARVKAQTALHNSKLARRTRGMANVPNSRGLGLAPYTPSGSILNARPAGTRAFSSESSRRDATQKEIDAANQRLPETLESINKTLKKRYKVWKNQEEGKMSISEKLEFLADKEIERDEVRHFDPVASNSWGLLLIKAAKALGYQTSPKTKAIEKIFFHTKDGQLMTRLTGFSTLEARAMRNFLAGLIAGENKVEDFSGSKYHYKKVMGWAYWAYDDTERSVAYLDKKYKNRRVGDLNYGLADALRQAAHQADPYGHKFPYGREDTSKLISELFLENPDQALDILTAWYNIGQGEGFQYEKTGRTAYEQYQQEQKERTRSQSQQQASRTGQQQQSAPRDPLQAKFDADLADFEAGKKSYVDMVKAWHPDPEQDPAAKAFKTEKMKVINSARK
jgi:hypothetical protein